jgi:hypothetical protein
MLEIYTHGQLNDASIWHCRRMRSENIGRLEGWRQAENLTTSRKTSNNALQTDTNLSLGDSRGSAREMPVHEQGGFA